MNKLRIYNYDFVNKNEFYECNNSNNEEYYIYSDINAAKKLINNIESESPELLITIEDALNLLYEIKNHLQNIFQTKTELYNKNLNTIIFFENKLLIIYIKCLIKYETSVVHSDFDYKIEKLINKTSKHANYNNCRVESVNKLNLNRRFLILILKNFEIIKDKNKLYKLMEEFKN